MPYFCFCNMNVTEDIYTEQDNLLGRIDLYVETLYLIFDYPYKYYTFKHFEV